MNDFSKEVIEIDGVEYTLFLNRAGLVAIEKFTKEEMQKVEEAQKLANFMEDNNAEINDDTDPLEGLDKVEEALNSIDTVKRDIYKKMFWIMLRTTHKLTPNECFELYDKAIEEYGEQVNKLIDQIVEDINIDKYTPKVENKNVKNLKALRPTK
jgi:predicted AlkP superfamily phosphohydrolase/phosphomutase